MRGTIRKWVLSLACTPILLCGAARGAFVNGTDYFSGTTLDSSTWATSGFNAGATFTQNYGLTINSQGIGEPVSAGGYTTTSALVGVGGSVWCQVQVNGVSSNAVSILELDLDTAPQGVNSFLVDGLKLTDFAQFDTTGTNVFHDIASGESFRSGGTGTSTSGVGMSSASPTIGSTYILQLQRLDATDIQVSSFLEKGFAADGKMKISLIGSGIMSQYASTANMYASLQTFGVDATFPSITINNPIGLGQTEVAVPEPGTLAILLATTGLALRRRGIPRI
jgi:hypothetical protein